jgi:predicted nucleic acid-binding protein
VLLVDASVWAALERPEDRYNAEARAIVLNLEQPVAALDLTLYEVANVAVRKFGQPQRAVFLTRLIRRRCADRMVRVDSDLIDAASALADEHGITAYDAAYVAAARHNGWTLVSGDLRDLVSKGLAVTPDAALYP